MDPATGLSFTRPEALVLALLLVPLAVYLSRTSMALMRRSRRRFSLALRLVIIALLVLALAGLEVVRAVDRLSVVFLLDRSDSIDAAGRAFEAAYVRDALQAMGENDAAGVVAFAAEALVDRPVVAEKSPPDLASAPTTTYSNLAEAIRLGLAVAPADTQRRMVLISDGRENVGSTEWAARLAAASGVPVDVVEVPSASGPEVWVESLTAPPTVRENERTSLEISVRSSADTTATLAVYMDGAQLGAQQVTLVRGTNNFVQNLPPVPPGFHSYVAQVIPPEGADTRRENNRYSAYSLVLGKPRILIVEKQPGESEALRVALSPSIDADVVSPARMPASVKDLAGYEGVVLVNVPATGLEQGSMESLRTLVRDLGKGLVVIGGDESYAAGGYFRTPFEEMLPVDLNLPSKLDIPTVGMALVIDRSGSMQSAHTVNGAGVTKLELAKEAAYRAVAQLSARDYVGVVTFDSAPDWVVPMQKLGDPAQFKDRIGGISTGGGTNIYSGLAPAVDALIESKAKSKHIVLLTDGVSEGGDYDGLLRKMADNAITVSTVAVGGDADTEFLKSLAARGGGRYYYTEEGNALPEIFAHESHFAARSYLIERPFSPERTSPSPILEGLGGLPGLQGYVGTSPKPAGQVVLVSDAGDPVLAQWQYGLGRVVAWTSDAKGQWAKDWIGWQDFPRFWAQALRWATGTEAGNNLQTRVEVEAGTAHITVDATAPDGSLLNDLAAEALVVAPDVSTRTLELRQSAPGRYEGEFLAREEGAYIVRVRASGQEVGNATQTLGVVVPYSPEYRASDADSELLPRLASLTGGRTLGPADAAAAFERNLQPVRSSTPLWPLLLTLAILLLPFDVGVRRVALYRADLARAAAELRRRLGIGQRPATAAAGASTPGLAALFGAKERIRERAGPGEGWRGDPRTTSAGSPQEPRLGERGGASPVPEARELQLTGRAGRDTQSAPPSGAAPGEKPPEAGPEDAGSLAAKLRKAREQRQ
jgi:Mg-chelatase subunit ChlD